MKKFNFKLDGVLKVREFKEKKIKIEMGEILKALNETKDAIQKLNDEISEAYHAQETALTQSGINAQALKFFPMFIQGKKEDIKNKENLLWALQKKYEKKVAELAQARGEVKVMENFKEKKKDEWKKEKDKKEQAAIEEILMMRRNGSSGNM